MGSVGEEKSSSEELDVGSSGEETKDDTETAEDGLDDLNPEEAAVFTTCGYFHGQLYRKGAEEMLTDKQPGSFLVREADRELVLSIKVADLIYPLQHHKFNLDHRGYFTINGCFFFNTIQDLIGHHISLRRPIEVGKRHLVISHPIGRDYWELLPTAIEVGPCVSASRFGIIHKGVLFTDTSTVRVGIKICRINKSRPIKRMFLSDAMALRLLGKNPNLLVYYGCSLLEDDIKMVKELSDLGSLRLYLASQTDGLSEADGAEMGLDAARAIGHLHSKGLMHLDVTSIAFFLFRPSTATDTPRLKLGNFYHARRTRRINIRNATIYEARWASPEVLGAESATTNSDIFSLANVLWEIWAAPLLPWNHLQDGPNLHAAILAALKPPNPVRLSIPGTLSKRAKALLTDCWAWTPDYRPAARKVESELAGLVDFYRQHPRPLPRPVIADSATPSSEVSATPPSTTPLHEAPSFASSISASHSNSQATDADL